MKKISSLVALALVGSMGCAAVYTAKNEETVPEINTENREIGSESVPNQERYSKPRLISNPEIILNSHGEYNEIIGRKIIKLLEDEFDHVGYYNLKSDLVIRGEKEMGGKYYTVYGLNLNCVCKAYALGRPVLDILLGKEVIADTCNASVVRTHSMNKKTAMDFAAILDLYINNNTERCQDWVEFMKKNYESFTPRE